MSYKQTPVHFIRQLAVTCCSARAFQFASISTPSDDSGFDTIDDPPLTLGEKAKKLKRLTGLGYWQCMIALRPESLVDGSFTPSVVGYHFGVGDNLHEVNRESLIQEGGGAIPVPTSSATVNFTSQVLHYDGAFGYVPLIDFRIKQSKTGNRVVPAVLDHIEKMSGVAFGYCESKSSYHGYGLAVVDFKKYIEVLGRALLFDPIVDGRHIGHQMIGGYGALRVI